MKSLSLIAFVGLALFTACQETPSERCAREAEEANRQCPKIIDANTRIDSIKYYGDSNKFCYYYSLKGQTDNELTTIIKSPENRLQTLQSLTNTAEMRYYLEQHVTFEYIYNSQESGIRLGSIQITPDDYRTP